MRVEFQKSTFRNILLSLARLGIYWVGWSPVAVGTAAGLYLIRMFTITAFYHRYAVSARQGFFWWEVDLIYYGLVVLPWLGIVRDLRPVPKAVRRKGTVPT